MGELASKSTKGSILGPTAYIKSVKSMIFIVVECLKENGEFSKLLLLYHHHINTRLKIHHFEAPKEKRKNSDRRKNSERPLSQPLQNRGFLGLAGSKMVKIGKSV